MKWDDSCLVCRERTAEFGSKTCNSKECIKKLPGLCRAMWEGHLLRNNVQPDEGKK